MRACACFDQKCNVATSKKNKTFEQLSSQLFKTISTKMFWWIERKTCSGLVLSFFVNYCNTMNDDEGEFKGNTFFYYKNFFYLH